MFQYYSVVLIESERGWGSRVDDTMYFATKKEAEDFVTEFNKSYTASVAPDWYMVAKGPTVHTVPNEVIKLILNMVKKEVQTRKRKKAKAKA